MSTTDSHGAAGHDGAGHGAGHDHAEPNFFFKYIWSTDHKMIGKQFLITGLLFFAIGGGLAMMFRWQLAHPNEPVPVVGQYLLASPEERQAAAEERALAAQEHRDPSSSKVNIGAVKPEQYSMLFTMHGNIMIFLVVIPLLVGAFGNFLIPLHCGTYDMAFPRLNAMSYWAFWGACVFVLLAFVQEGGGASAGWTMYPPLADLAKASPGSGNGQTCWLIALFLVGSSSIMGAVNYLTTILTMRAPGLSMFRLPLVTWAQFITAVLQLLATPVLASAIAMQLMDRLLGTTFFLPGNLLISSVPVDADGRFAGGQVLLWQHVFWFYSHPAVYILILPGMGMASELLSTFARKPIFGYRAMVFSISGIAGLGFIVWAHHMFMSGMNPMLGMAFMTSTMLIALPSSVKVFNWLGTLWGGSIRFTVPMVHGLTFVAMFVIGGLSGIFMAATPVDIHIHDTYYIVAHFHYVVFGGSIFAIFGSIHFWFPKMFGRMMNNKLGYLHWICTFIGFNGVFFPQHILGAAGHMRRIADPTAYGFLAPVQHWNVVITNFAFFLGATQIFFVINFFWSMYRGPKAEVNPWNCNTLEWTIPSPPGHGNYPVTPTVYRGPYEYSHPELQGRDWISQAEPPPGGPGAAQPQPVGAHH